MKPINLVYVVEDDKIASFVIKLTLENHASILNSFSFQNGKEAFDELSNHKTDIEKLPDLILLDLNMPIMDGWEFLDSFSKLNYDKEISVIILTSSINPEDAQKAKNFQVVKGFLSKPLTVEKLNKVLELI